MKPRNTLLAGAIMSALWMSVPVQAEDTNTVELIKQLQRRIEDLERKVKTLKQEKGTGAEAPDTPAKPGFEELDQKAKAIKRDREAEPEAAAAKLQGGSQAKGGPRGVQHCFRRRRLRPAVEGASCRWTRGPFSTNHQG